MLLNHSAVSIPLVMEIACVDERFKIALMLAE